MISMDRKYNDLIGDILHASGEKDNFPNKGKPLPKEYVKKDVYQNFLEKAKEAGYLPPWLRLQKEICSLLEEAKTEADIKKINEKVQIYNLNCPAPMQRSLISLETLDRSRQVWLK